MMTQTALDRDRFARQRVDELTASYPISIIPAAFEALSTDELENMWSAYTEPDALTGADLRIKRMLERILRNR